MLFALRRFAKSVMVVSCEHGGTRYAMSATAVSEVSLDPPTMLICVNRQTNLFGALSEGADFAINILHSGQEEIARNCGGAVRGEERFAVGAWENGEGGPPYLSDAQASFICRQVKFVEHGTHGIFLGEVQAVHVLDAVDPLIYVDGRYRAL